ncbi:MAG: hypothetical protein ACK5N8_05790 [Alphaproteobacteria bacterium]
MEIDEKICQRALDTWGKTAQMSMVFEEMSELQIELLKNINRGKDNIEKIIDECADVNIMLRQVELCYNIKEEVQKRIEFKLNRLVGRLDEWDENHKK